MLGNKQTCGCDKITRDPELVGKHIASAARKKSKRHLGASKARCHLAYRPITAVYCNSMCPLLDKLLGKYYPITFCLGDLNGPADTGGPKDLV